MKSKTGQHGWGWIIFGLLAIAFFIYKSNDSEMHKATPYSDRQEPMVTATISDLKQPNRDELWFTLNITNRYTTEKTVYAVVYGKNDSISPPQREAWPFAGLLFSMTGNSDRGTLYASDIKKLIKEKTDLYFLESAKLVLAPNSLTPINGALPIPDVSPHNDWKGQHIEQRVFDELTLWIFSLEGEQIFEVRYSNH
jgi:hypothetical protein